MSCYNTALNKRVILVRTCIVGTHSNHLIEIFQVSTTTNVFAKTFQENTLFSRLFQGHFKIILNFGGFF